MERRLRANLRGAKARTLLLPICVLLLGGFFALFLSLFGAPTAAIGQTAPASPLPTPAATPKATPKATTAAGPAATPAPHPTPRPGADSRVRAEGEILTRALGDRRSATVYGLSESGALYRSDNHGIYWDWVTDSPATGDFILSPDDPGVLYSSLPLVCDEEGAAPPLWLSSDSGWSWTIVEDGPPLEPLWADGEDSLRALAAGCDGLYETIDGGASWLPLSTRADSRLWDNGIATALVDSDESLYVLVSETDGSSLVAVSADSGNTWRLISPQGLEPPFAAVGLAVDPATPGRLWAVGPQGVWVTEDQGQFWGLTAMGLEDALEGGLTDIVFHPNNLLFAASKAGFYSKEAGTREWEKLGSETLGLRVDSLLLLESAPRRLWLNTEIGVYRFLIR